MTVTHEKHQDVTVSITENRQVIKSPLSSGKHGGSLNSLISLLRGMEQRRLVNKHYCSTKERERRITACSGLFWSLSNTIKIFERVLYNRACNSVQFEPSVTRQSRNVELHAIQIARSLVEKAFDNRCPLDSECQSGKKGNEQRFAVMETKTLDQWHKRDLYPE